VGIDLKVLPVEAKLQILEAIKDPEAARWGGQEEQARRWDRHCAKWGLPVASLAQGGHSFARLVGGIPCLPNRASAHTAFSITAAENGEQVQ
jgi:hypothetical protein